MHFSLLALLLLATTATLLGEARVQKAAVIVRVPRRGAFVLDDAQQRWTMPSKDKLSGEETATLVDLGRRLRELYIRASRVLPHEFDSSKILFQSAESPRAIQAMQAIGAGLYEASFGRGMADFLPVTVVSKPLDDLLQMNCARGGTDEGNERWSALVQEVAGAFGLELNSGEDWILESAALATQDVTLQQEINKVMRQTRASGEGATSRLAHQVFVEFFASSAQQGLKLFVFDDERVMTNFLPSDEFPSPRMLLVELQDETELDPYSKQQFVRIFKDGVPIPCASNAGEEEYCEVSAYIASIASRLQSRDEWKKACESMPVVPPSVAPPLIIETAAPVAITTTDAPTSNQTEVKSVILPSTVPVVTCTPQIIPMKATEDDFVLGFAFGSLFTIMIMYWCCIGGRDESQQYIARVKHELSRQESNSLLLAQKLDVNSASSPGGSRDVESLTKPTSRKPGASHVMAHIPRHSGGESSMI